VDVYKHLIKPLLFSLDPERAHNLISTLLRLPLLPRLISQKPVLPSSAGQQNIGGLNFPNPVGLAAGFDKNALLLRALSDWGFGFVEIGTVTPRPQPGNPPPRLFRLPGDEAIINRMGFNNDGVEAIRQRLLKRPAGIIVGGNIGKNKDTPNNRAIDDYRICFEKLHDVVDYFTVNVSSPNTPNLRALQEKEPLRELLTELQALNKQLPRPKPILLKISPDLSNSQLDDIIDVVGECNLTGIIATNTTVSRQELKTPPEILQKIGSGGLSGKPLAPRSTEIVRHLHQRTEGKLPIIGVGGIHSYQTAQEKFRAGASLIQIYTGLIYEGPGLVGRILKAIG